MKETKKAKSELKPGQGSGKKILLIEDSKEMAALLTMHLRDDGYQLTHVLDGKAGLEKVYQENFDLVILDLMLPEIGGLEVCQEIRRLPVYVPIVMLTAKTSEEDRVTGLEFGADDYVIKPFSIKELLARIRALFRRVDALNETKEELSKTLDFPNLKIEIAKRKVNLRGRVINLTGKEFDLLLLFAKNPGRVFTRSQILDLVWGFGHDGFEHTVNSHINRLRGKIEKDSRQPEFILTIWGVGYKFRGRETE